MERGEGGSRGWTSWWSKEWSGLLFLCCHQNPDVWPPQDVSGIIEPVKV